MLLPRSSLSLLPSLDRVRNASILSLATAGLFVTSLARAGAETPAGAQVASSAIPSASAAAGTGSLSSGAMDRSQQLLLAKMPVAISAEELRDSLKRSACWQLAHPHGNTPVTDWIIAPLYDGLLRLALTTGDERFLSAVIAKGRQAGWQPQYRVYFADDYAVGHAWLDVWELDHSHAERLQPMKDRLDFVLAHPRTQELDMRRPQEFPGIGVTDRWTWCDALYMGPPTLSKLYRATGDKRYLDFLDREYRFTYDHLWSAENQLFFRDGNFLEKKSANGKPVFWARGNGWVLGGLCLLLEDLPADHPTRGFYETLFKQLAEGVLACQQSDGLWRPNLLDPKQVDVGETSSSGFFVFGFAWGINHGLLDRERYWMPMERGLRGLLTRVKPDGFVGYVQRVGLAPDSVGPDSRQDYGTGAFLLAGSEVLRALGAATPPADLRRFMARAEEESVLTVPRAYARQVPERKDDIAIENDRVAFRIYGPALRNGVEASGIDVWCKRTEVPVVDRWYALDLAGKQSYHEDHGEGYDGYKVADSLGCGGLGLWIDGKLVIPRTYEDPRVYDTAPGEARVVVVYRYPKIGDKEIEETRTLLLRLGEQTLELSSHFKVRGGGKASDLTVAAGLFTQTGQPVVIQDKAAGVTAVWETVDGAGLGLGLAVAPTQVVDMLVQPFGDKREHALVLLHPDKDGDLHYRAGFAWAKAGLIKDLEAWKQHLAERAK